jgi:hypothetical protein
MIIFRTGTFEDLKKRLRNDSFSQLSEKAATRTAIELNDLMRTFGAIQNPEAVSSQLSNVARLAFDLENALRNLSGSAVPALLGVEDPVACRFPLRFDPGFPLRSDPA